MEISLVKLAPEPERICLQYFQPYITAQRLGWALAEKGISFESNEGSCGHAVISLGLSISIVVWLYKISRL